MTQADLRAFMAKQKLGVLGSNGPDGNPQSALVGIAVTPELEIVFDTLRNTRKYVNLAARPSCSFVIGGWGAGEQTIQYEGEAEELVPATRDRYLELYLEVWPECQVHLTWPGITHFRVSPTWIRYSDFDANPPLIREFNYAKVLMRQAGGDAPAI